MKCKTLSALVFAASIALAIAVPARNYYYEDEYPESRHLSVGRPVSLANAPFYYQSRHLELDDLPQRGRKYQIVKRKKVPGAPPGGGSDEDDDAADDDESNESSEEDEEEDDENAGEDNEEESADVPPWEALFPEDDKNTGEFQQQDQPGGQGGYGGGQGGYGGGQGGPGGYGGGQGGPGGPPEDMQGGGSPAPQSGGSSLLSLLTGGGGNKPQNEGQGGYGGPGGPQGGYGGGGPGGPQGGYGGGGPGGPQGGPQYRHALLPSEEEPRSGVLYSPHTDRYIPVRPVQVRIPKRQSKKVKKVTPKIVPDDQFQGRSLRPVTSSKKTAPKKQYVLMPVERDSREIRFGRDRHVFRPDSGPAYPPTDIWRWGGRSGKPTGLYYAPRPHRGSASSIRFAVAPESDY